MKWWYTSTHGIDNMAMTQVWPLEVYMLNPDGDPWKEDYQNWVHLPRFGGSPNLVRVLPQYQVTQCHSRQDRQEGLVTGGLHRGRGLWLSRPPHHLSTITTGVYPEWTTYIYPMEVRRNTLGALFSSLDQPAKHHETCGYQSFSAIHLSIFNSGSTEIHSGRSCTPWASHKVDQWGLCLYLIPRHKFGCIWFNMQIYPDHHEQISWENCSRGTPNSWEGEPTSV